MSSKSHAKWRAMKDHRPPERLRSLRAGRWARRFPILGETMRHAATPLVAPEPDLFVFGMPDPTHCAWDGGPARVIRSIDDNGPVGSRRVARADELRGPLVLGVVDHLHVDVVVTCGGQSPVDVLLCRNFRQG